jgi:RNA-directed DNA polymerase
VVASEKAEIIAQVEQLHLPTKRTLNELRIILGTTFYKSCDRCRKGGVEILANHRSRPDLAGMASRMASWAQIIGLAPKIRPSEVGFWE